MYGSGIARAKREAEGRIRRVLPSKARRVGLISGVGSSGCLSVGLFTRPLLQTGDVASLPPMDG